MDFVTLLQDLLSTHETVPREIYVAIAHHLASLPIPLVERLLTVLLSSSILANDPPYQTHSSLYQALAEGLGRRIKLNQQLYGLGWRSRRKCSTFFESLCRISQSQSSNSPITALTLQSAALCVLCAGQRDGIVSRTLVKKVEQHIVALWSALDLSQVSNSAKPFIAWMASQSLGDLPLDHLRQISETMLSLLTSGLEGLFDGGHIFESLNLDIVSVEGSLQWLVRVCTIQWLCYRYVGGQNPSPSRKRLDDIILNPLYSNLGRLSKLLSRTIESAQNLASLEAVLQTLQFLTRFSKTLMESWQSSSWQGSCKDNPKLEEETLPWSILKSILFSLTLIHFGVVSLLNTSSRPDSPPSELAEDLVFVSLQSMQNVYFITSKFGHEGFAIYQAMWLGLVDVAERSPVEKVSALINKLEIREPQDEISEACFAYWLILSEELMERVDEATMSRLLNAIIPHLTKPGKKLLCETSHITLISVLLHNPNLAVDLLPWYHDLLVQQPALLTRDQFFYAYSTLIRVASTIKDALAWSCLTKLSDLIRQSNPEERPLLQETLLKQLDEVSTALFKPLLQQVDFLLEGSSTDERRLLLALAHTQVEQLRDVTKRAIGVKWCLQHRKKNAGKIV